MEVRAPLLMAAGPGMVGGFSDPALWQSASLNTWPG